MSKVVHYGNIVVFVKKGLHLFALLQKYTLSTRFITDYVDIPLSLQSNANELFPLLQLSDVFLLIPVETIIHKLFVYKIVSTANTYAKHYLNRRTNTENIIYNFVIFSSDNSTAVVKAKQCSPAEHDGFVLVQSGKKKLMGVILEEAINIHDNIPLELPTITLLGENCLSTSRGVQELSKSHHKNTYNLKRKRHKQSHNETSSTVSFGKFDNTDSDSNDSENEQLDNSEHNIHTNQPSTEQTPIFLGCSVPQNNKKSKNESAKVSSSVTQQLLAFTNKLESQYLKPILVTHERIETLTKKLFNNQKKIQNMNISLLEPDDNDESTINHTFRSSVEYKLPDGSTIDLLQKAGVKEHANRYVTSLMDTLFKPEELLSIETKNISKDERYILLKDQFDQFLVFIEQNLSLLKTLENRYLTNNQDNFVIQDLFLEHIRKALL
ncbi:unnamed protein product [Rotaria sp. Silwood2]|nr:unnamed protein product [Rotaria sp. Silwood2]CAF3927069.1 unnamed protein product [Rotaria sp. Silwood2]CAF4459272.1 unnamed protein product [Rotaria sp. Silwood2]CAF4466178.1 unnamed protein product [Rotaria sp. Silwood2]CAF4534567.1 unnamed protein product [Rotaria sp. Silwood2]